MWIHRERRAFTTFLLQDAICSAPARWRNAQGFRIRILASSRKFRRYITPWRILRGLLALRHGAHRL